MKAAADQAPFAVVVERPTSVHVRAHTLQVARFQGWIASAGAAPGRVRVTVGDADPYEVAAALPRPDVLAFLGDSAGLKSAFGFSFFVDLPPGFTEPLPVTLAATDGVRTVTLPTYFVEQHVDLTCLDTFIGDPPALRELARRHLRGAGLEFGALHMPVELDHDVATVRYADRCTKADSLATYPEMHVPFGDAMVDVDFVVDLDHSTLTELEPFAFDFFVANGVFEHLANPLLFLSRLHDVMKPGARLLLTVPDRDYTFDSLRALTPHEHLFEEYAAGITHVSDAHLTDALRHILPGPLPTEPAERKALFDFHRERSIHVHVWDQRSFDDLLRLAAERLPLRFDVVESASSRAGEGSSIYVLEKRAR